MGDKDAEPRRIGSRVAGQSDTCDVGGEEVDAVAVEVAAGAVVVLGGAGVGVSRQDLSISERDTGVESVGDRGVTQRVWAEVSGDTVRPCDPGDYALAVASVDRLAGDRT
jgi:hypothetical protein